MTELVRKISLVLICLLLSCINANADELGAPALRVGVGIPLSGPADWLGKDMLDGMTLFREQTTGKQIYLVVEDVTSDNTSRGIAAVRKLIDIDKVDGLVLQMSPVANATAQFIDAAYMPTIAVVGADCAKDRKYMVKLWVPAANEAKAIYEYFQGKPIRRLAFLTAEQDSTIARSDALKSIANSRLDIVSDLRFSSTDDLRTLALRTLKAQPQLTVINAMPGQAGLLARHLRELGYKGNFAVSVVSAEKSDREVAAGALKGAVYPDADLSPEFVSAFEKKFHHKPGPVSATGYDALKIFYESSLSLDKASNHQELNKLIRVKNFSGALGRYSFKNDSLNTFDLRAVIRVIDH